MENLTKKLNHLSRSEATRKRGFKKAWITRIIAVLVILFVVIYLPARGAYLAYKQVLVGGKMISAGAKQENLDNIRQGVAVTKQAVSSLNGSLNWMIWMSVIPFGGGYYSDLRHFSRAAEYELDAAAIISASLDPYKSELGLAGQATAGQDRVAQGVKILDKALPQMDKIEPDLLKARKEVEGIDTGKYPEKLGSRILRANLEAAKDFIVGADVALTQNRDALEIAPSALGSDSPKNYLLLFQNDKELRATGGFLTAFAFLHLDKGHLTSTTSDDIYRLDEQLLKVCQNKVCPLTPPAPIVRYLPEADGKPRTAWSMRDSNLSPDLPTSMQEFEKMYSYLGSGIKFDGIITIDTQVVEGLMQVTGPVDVFGTTYSAETDKRCNCSGVIYQLEHYAEIAAKGENDRKAILGTLMQEILAKSLGAGPDKMPAFLNTGIQLAGDKHIMFYMHDPATQAALSKLGWTGEIKQTSGGYLHINDSNFAGGKSNLYVDEKVTLDINIDSGGNVKNKVTVEYKNPQPFNTWLNGILRDYVRLYVPEGASLISSKGSDVAITTQNDDGLAKTYFESFITVRPQNSRVLSFEYSLPDKVSGKNYKLLIQKQPGAKDHHYIIKINGSKKAEFDLTSDKTLDLSF